VDIYRFETLTRAIASGSSRRTVLGLALGGLLTAIAMPDADGERRNRRRKNKNKKPAFNEFGCVNVGGKCRGNDGLCCSGICLGKKPKKGKRDKSRCAAHNVGSCQAEQDSCAASQVSCGVDAFCFRTTGKASFCGGPGGGCVDCKTDKDCEAFFAPGSACVVCDSCGPAQRTLCNEPANIST
jgi:hypothetical protein